MIRSDETDRITAMLGQLGCRLVDHRSETIRVKTRHEIEIDLVGPTLHRQRATIKFETPPGGGAVAALGKLVAVIERRLARLDAMTGGTTPFAMDGPRTPVSHLTIEEHAIPVFSSIDELRGAFVALADRSLTTSVSLLDDSLVGHGNVDARGLNAHGTHLSIWHGDVGNGMSLNGTRLVLDEPLPSTILSSLVGRRVSEVIAGTTFGDYVIRRADDAGTATYLTLASRRIAVSDALSGG